MTKHLTHGRRRDWFMILRHLMRANVSMHQVGRKCGRNIKTVMAWADSSEPKESDARTVLALYAKHCPTQYLEHQRQYEITVEIEAVTNHGENRVLPFVGRA